jgi:hypothetical protein
VSSVPKAFFLQIESAMLAKRSHLSVSLIPPFEIYFHMMLTKDTLLHTQLSSSLIIESSQV